jgi:putative ABC transport system permease protein
VVLTLGVGIGASTAAFSVADGIVFRPLPVRDEGRLVVMWAKQRDFAHVPMRWADVDRYAAETRAFERVGGVDYNGTWTWAMSDRGTPAPIKGTWVTGDFFAVLDVTPQVGRMIMKSDDVPNAPCVAVISDALWRTRFGSDASIVGRTLTYDGKQVTIVGVAPRGFEYPKGVELWSAVLAFSPDTRSDSASGSLDVVARLRGDATMEQGRREFDAYLDRAYSKWRTAIGKFEGTARTLPQLIVGEVKPALFSIFGAAALVLIIACLNVANLLLVRGVARSHELAVRASLGAARHRVVAQLMTESSILGVCGAAVGVALAWLAVRGLTVIAPPDIPRLGEVTVDLRVLAFACTATIAGVLLFGLGPALTLARGDLSALVGRAVSRSSTATRGAAGTKQLLITAQAALAVLVLATAGLLTRSLINLRALDLGFERDRVIIAQLSMTWSRFATADGMDRLTLLLDQLTDAVRALPGVTSVAVASSAPYSGTGGWDALPGVEGQSDAERLRLPWVNMEIVTADYFGTLGVRLLQGRLLAAADRKGSALVTVVNDAMAHRYWPDRAAIGQRLRLGAADDPKAPWYTVVGVVADMRYRELATAMPSFYLPNRQYARGVPSWFVIRTVRSPDAIVAPLRRAFAAVDADASVLGVRTMADYLAEPLVKPRFSSLLVATFAGVALLLVAVGISAVIGEHVRQRRREIGIRLALGARVADITRIVLRSGLRPVGLGLAAGLALALIVARLVQPQLYGVKSTDPLTMIASLLGVLLIAAVACIVPARSAARVNPVEVMRAD